MRYSLELILCVVLIAICLFADQVLGHRPAIFIGLFSLLWFGVAMVLLTRPPAIPEFVSEEIGSDEQYVIRKDVLPKLPFQTRLRLSLGVAAGAGIAIVSTLIFPHILPKL